MDCDNHLDAGAAMSFCTKCGQRLAAGVRFCTSCGAQVQPPAPTPQAPGPPARSITGLRRPRLEGRRATVALVAAAVLIAAGIIAGFQFAGHHGPVSAAGHTVSRPKHRGPAPLQTAVLSPVVNSSASFGPTSSAPASPPPSASSAGAGTVRIGPLAAQHPAAGKVAAFLSRYFAAIKNRNYAAYAALFAGNALPNTTARQFRNGYRSTTDSDAELVSLSSGSAGLAAAVTFRSHQDPAASATHTSCTLWGVTFYLQQVGSSYLIGSPPAGYHASYKPC